MGRYDEARRHLELSFDLASQPRSRVNCLTNMGTTFLEEWRLDEADAMYQAAHPGRTSLAPDIRCNAPPIGSRLKGRYRG